MEEGQTHAIIGPNGAGKSTLLNVIIGKLAPTSGQVIFDGAILTGRKPYQINQLGIARVFQTPEIFADLSVLHNVMIPALAKRDGAFRLNMLRGLDSEAAILSEAEAMLEDVGMHSRRDMPAGSLSRGDKRRMELAMCLIQHPRLLLLDEPTAGMSRHDTNTTIELLKKIKSRGMTKVIIEHDMHVVFSSPIRFRCWRRVASSPMARPTRCVAIPRFRKPISEAPIDERNRHGRAER